MALCWQRGEMNAHRFTSGSYRAVFQTAQVAVLFCQKLLAFWQFSFGWAQRRFKMEQLDRAVETRQKRVNRGVSGCWYHPQIGMTILNSSTRSSEFKKRLFRNDVVPKVCTGVLKVR